MLDALQTEQWILFPLRHHSPACAWHVAQIIRQEQPATILVEGPESFTPLIPLILHEKTRAPFAVYTHYVHKFSANSRKGQPKPSEPDEADETAAPKKMDMPPARFAAYYPFCDYSPELVALQEGHKIDAQLQFIDLNYPDQVLAELSGQEDGAYSPRVESLLQERYLQHSDYVQELARRSGCRDGNDLWDHLFEANYQELTTSQFMCNVAAYCYMARLTTPPEILQQDGTEARERKMAFAVGRELKRLQRSQTAQKILVLTGGFHTVALPELLGSTLKKPKEAKISQDARQEVLIRYSFDHLDALNGYASGMPSPQYYQKIWEKREQEPKLALCELANTFLVELGRLTREENQQNSLSTADEIAAFQQAVLLADFRGHPGPTREDLLDGIRSCFVKGGMEAEGLLLLGQVYRLLSGNTIGYVPPEAGAPPILDDFRTQAKALGLSIDEVVRKELSLDLYRKRSHRKRSRFFHSLIFLNISFPVFQAGPDFLRGTDLERLQERWQYCWSPRTESSLIDIAVYGSTLEEAAINRMQERIAQMEEAGEGRNAAAAVTMLIQACRMGLQHHAGRLLVLIEDQIAEEAHFASAVHAATQLFMLQQAREPLEAHDLPEVPRLLTSAYLRSCYLFPSLVHCPDEQIEENLQALNSVRELLAGDAEEQLDADIFWEGCAALLAQQDCHFTIAGAITGLLYGEGRLDENELLRHLQGYLGAAGGSWEQKTGFLRGLLFSCREIAWQQRRFLGLVDRLMREWEEDDFLKALPDMRLAFADLTPRETDRVAESVAGLYGEQDLGDMLTRDISEELLQYGLKLDSLVRKSLKNDLIEHG